MPARGPIRDKLLFGLGQNLVEFYDQFRQVVECIHRAVCTCCEEDFANRLAALLAFGFRQGRKIFRGKAHFAAAVGHADMVVDNAVITLLYLRGAVRACPEECP